VNRPDTHWSWEENQHGTYYITCFWLRSHCLLCAWDLWRALQSLITSSRHWLNTHNCITHHRVLEDFRVFVKCRWIDSYPVSLPDEELLSHFSLEVSVICDIANHEDSARQASCLLYEAVCKQQIQQTSFKLVTQPSAYNIDLLRSHNPCFFIFPDSPCQPALQNVHSDILCSILYAAVHCKTSVYSLWSINIRLQYSMF